MTLHPADHGTPQDPTGRAPTLATLTTAIRTTMAVHRTSVTRRTGTLSPWTWTCAHGDAGDDHPQDYRAAADAAEAHLATEIAEAVTPPLGVYHAALGAFHGRVGASAAITLAGVLDDDDAEEIATAALTDVLLTGVRIGASLRPPRSPARNLR